MNILQFWLFWFESLLLDLDPVRLGLTLMGLACWFFIVSSGLTTQLCFGIYCCGFVLLWEGFRSRYAKKLEPWIERVFSEPEESILELVLRRLKRGDLPYHLKRLFLLVNMDLDSEEAREVLHGCDPKFVSLVSLSPTKFFAKYVKPHMPRFAEKRKRLAKAAAGPPRGGSPRPEGELLYPTLSRSPSDFSFADDINDWGDNLSARVSLFPERRKYDWPGLLRAARYRYRVTKHEARIYWDEGPLKDLAFQLGQASVGKLFTGGRVRAAGGGQQGEEREGKIVGEVGGVVGGVSVGQESSSKGSSAEPSTVRRRTTPPEESSGGSPSKMHDRGDGGLGHQLGGLGLLDDINSEVVGLNDVDSLSRGAQQESGFHSTTRTDSLGTTERSVSSTGASPEHYPPTSTEVEDQHHPSSSPSETRRLASFDTPKRSLVLRTSEKRGPAPLAQDPLATTSSPPSSGALGGGPGSGEDDMTVEDHEDLPSSASSPWLVPSSAVLVQPPRPTSAPARKMFAVPRGDRDRSPSPAKWRGSARIGDDIPLDRWGRPKLAPVLSQILERRMRNLRERYPVLRLAQILWENRRLLFAFLLLLKFRTWIWKLLGLLLRRAGVLTGGGAGRALGNG